MIFLSDLANYLDQLLNCQNIRDYCPNGLQVSGKKEIKKFVTGVTASEELIKQAIAKDADAILVHHGLFWQRDNPCIVGMKYQRIKLLIEHEIALLSYHLPLDIHQEFGNNVKLAELFNFDNLESHFANDVPALIWTGKSCHNEIAKLIYHIEAKLNRKILHIPPFRERSIEKIAWCTGAAQDLITTAIDLNCSVFISGEISERTVHIARECGIHYLACGHHDTERYGIKALGEHLSEKFSLHHSFLDISNPV